MISSNTAWLRESASVKPLVEIILNTTSIGSRGGIIQELRPRNQKF